MRPLVAPLVGALVAPLQDARADSGVVIAPPILNNVEYTYGTWTATGTGGVSLRSPTLKNAGGSPFVDPASGVITAFTLDSVVTGTAAHFNSAVDVAAERTPQILGPGFKSTGVFEVRIKASGPGGDAYANIKINRDATACTIGDSSSNYDFAVIGSAASTAYAGGFRSMLIATGTARSGANVILLNASFTFSGVVAIKYANPLVPSILSGVVLFSDSITNVDIQGVQCAGYSSTSFYGNFQLQGLNVACTNCKVLDTEAGYVGTNAFVGFAVSGATTTARITFSVNDTMAVSHKYRGIYVESSTSVLIEYPFLSLFHAQGVYYSPLAKGIKIIEPVIIGQFRTVTPTVDVNTHQEPAQAADPGTGSNGYPVGAKVEGLEIYGLIASPTIDTNSGGRGIVMGNAIGRVVCDGAVCGGWIGDVFESYGFGAGSVFKRICGTRVRAGDETLANAINDENKVPGYDKTLSGARFRVEPTSLPGGATLEADEIYIDASVTFSATALGVATLGPDIYGYGRNPMTAGNGSKYSGGSPDPVGFAAANPKTAMEALFNDPSIRTMTHKQIRDAVAAIWNRPDGKGPFANTAGNPWRYSILP